MKSKTGMVWVSYGLRNTPLAATVSAATSSGKLSAAKLNSICRAHTVRQPFRAGVRVLHSTEYTEGYQPCRIPLKPGNWSFDRSR